MLLPTVGRVVYYKSQGSVNGKYPSVDRAAIVTEVPDAEAGIVSLCVLNPEGMYFNRNVQQGDEAGQWNWMPFQRTQHAKDEAIESIPAVQEAIAGAVSTQPNYNIKD